MPPIPRTPRPISIAMLVTAVLCLAACTVAPRPFDPSQMAARMGSMEDMARLLKEAQAREQAQQASGCEATVQQRLNKLRPAAEPDDLDFEIINQGLAQCRQLKDRRGERAVLGMLSNLRFVQGDYRATIEAQREALALADAVEDKARAWEALGRSFLAAGDHANALKAYREAFEMAQRASEAEPELRAQALRGQGLVHLDQRDYAAAARAFEGALALSQEGQEDGDDLIFSGPILSSLGVAQLRGGQLKAAEASLRRALAASEGMRSGLRQAERQLDQGVPAALRSILPDTESMLREWMPHAAALMVDSYTCSLLQDLLVAQQRNTEALEISERCRGRVLVQRLAVRALPEEAQPPTIAQIRAIAKEQQATLVEYTIVYEPSALPDWIPDKEAALLILVVAPDGAVSARRVALGAEFDSVVGSISDLVDVLRLGMGARGRSVTRERVRASQVEAAKARTTAAAQSRPRQLHRLLIEPIADLLPRDPDARVVFVPQESLFLVPFAALQDASGGYVAEKHTISITPSIHTLAFTHRQRQRDQGSMPPQGERALIVGNPKMPSYSIAPGVEPQPLPDLPDAEVEAKAIAQLMQTQALTGDQATKAAFTAGLPKAQLIHLATHGLLDDLSQSRARTPFARHTAITSLLQPGTAQFRAPGSLALAPDARDSGLLTADEIASLRTPAQLVVMSACDTGRGAIVGDGVIGLARSWIASGVPTVVASLWAVPDEPTGELMLAFHQQLRQRQDKAWALRQAMLQTRKRFPDPVNWASFVVIGEAR